MAEQTSISTAEGQVSKDATDKSNESLMKDSEGSTTIYDDVFHTIAQKLPQLMIALINLCFGTNYPEDVEYQHIRNEHYHRSGKLITDFLMIINGITYHFECQSKPDGTMVLRMMEYDFMIAFELAWLNDSDRLKLPSSCVVYLRHTKNTPDEHRMTIEGSDGQTMIYHCRVLKAQNYTLDEMFEKNLLMLLPYYIMRYEKQFPRIEEDDDLRTKFLSEIQTLSDRLREAVRPEEKAVIYPDLIQLINDIADYELQGYQKTLEGVKKIMGGRILPLPSDYIRKAEEEHRTYVNTMNTIYRNLYNKGNSIQEIAETTGQTIDTVTSGLRFQGFSV